MTAFPVIFLDLVYVIPSKGEMANQTFVLALDHHKNVIPEPLNPFPERELFFGLVPSLRYFIGGVFISYHFFLLKFFLINFLRAT